MWHLEYANYLFPFSISHILLNSIAYITQLTFMVNAMRLRYIARPAAIMQE